MLTAANTTSLIIYNKKMELFSARVLNKRMNGATKHRLDILQASLAEAEEGLLAICKVVGPLADKTARRWLSGLDEAMPVIGKNKYFGTIPRYTPIFQYEEE